MQVDAELLLVPATAVCEVSTRPRVCELNGTTSTAVVRVYRSQEGSGQRWGGLLQGHSKARELQSPFLIPSSEGALGLLLLEAIDDDAPRLLLLLLLPPLEGGEHRAGLDRGRAHGRVVRLTCPMKSLMQTRRRPSTPGSR